MKQSLAEPFSSLEAQAHHNLSEFYVTYCSYIVPWPLPGELIILSQAPEMRNQQRNGAKG
jgi:hypothetical protein